nr:PREDICTED: regucalcin-like [Bemisia tabaci]
MLETRNLESSTGGPASESNPAERVPNRGSFYSYSTEICGLKREISNVTVSNGLAWNKDDTILYYIDSGTFKVAKFDYDRRTGVISNPETVFDFKANKIPGLLPHGMTIDTEDNLYVAMYGGYRIVKIDATRGVLLRTIKLPVALVTDMIWGGRDLDILFVTSSRMGLNETEVEEQPWAGRVIAVTGLNATGCISHEAVICFPGRPEDTDICSAPS